MGHGWNLGESGTQLPVAITEAVAVAEAVAVTEAVAVAEAATVRGQRLATFGASRAASGYLCFEGVWGSISSTRWCCTVGERSGGDLTGWHAATAKKSSTSSNGRRHE